MGLLGSRKEDTKLGFAPNEKDYLNSNTLVSASTRIEGSIQCEGNLRIDGVIKGDISCDNKLIIGTQGVVEGNVRSNHLDLEGVINGDIKVMSGFKLKSTGKLIGNLELYSGVLEVEQGATFNGICDMNKNKTESAEKVDDA